MLEEKRREEKRREEKRREEKRREEKMLLAKKRGFTLSEALIAFLIIGALIGLLIRAIPRTLPNKDKVLYLKAYRNLENAVSTYVNNPAYFNQSFGATTNADLSQPRNYQDGFWMGKCWSWAENSFYNAMVTEMNTMNGNGDCGNWDSHEFKTTDGIHWQSVRWWGSAFVDDYAAGRIEVNSLTGTDPRPITVWLYGKKTTVGSCRCSTERTTISDECRIKCGRYRICVDKDGRVYPPLNNNIGSSNPCSGAQAATLTIEQRMLLEQTDVKNR